MRSSVPTSVLATFLLAISVVSAGNLAVADAMVTACGGEDVKPLGAPSGRVATAQKPAVLRVPSDKAKSGVALEVTARPVAGEDSLYLVGVYADRPNGSGMPELLGSFSFLPARVGKAQTFVLPMPDGGPPARDLTLSIKLIRANAARDIKDAAVEILAARIVGE